MINQEEIYRLLMQKEWAKIVKILHRHKAEIAGDAVLVHAAQTFERELIREVPSYDPTDNEILDVLGTVYVLHHGNFYVFTDENIKIITLELAKRAPLQEGYNYARKYPDEIVSKEIIRKYEAIFAVSDHRHQAIAEVSHLDWIGIFNRLFEMMKDRENTATYFSGPKFLKVVSQVYPYYPDYIQYIALRNEQGRSTSRKIFFYDIFMELKPFQRIALLDNILHDLRPFEPVRAAALDMLLGRETFNEAVVESTALPETTAKRPVVFISYSWDTIAYKEWVLWFAKRLIDDGIDVVLDQFESKLGRNLPVFVEQSIARADRVIILFTPDYKEKCDARKGGVGYEYSIMNADLYDNQAKNDKIIPVLRQGTKTQSIPAFMRQFIHLDMTKDDVFEERYQELIRDIYNEPAIVRPPLGDKPDFTDGARLA